MEERLDLVKSSITGIKTQEIPSAEDGTLAANYISLLAASCLEQSDKILQDGFSAEAFSIVATINPRYHIDET